MSAARSAVRSVARRLCGDARAAPAVCGGQRQGAQHHEHGDPAGRADPGVAPVEALARQLDRGDGRRLDGVTSTGAGARRSALRRSWPAAGGSGTRRSALRRSCVCTCAAGNCRSGFRRSWLWAAAVAGIAIAIAIAVVIPKDLSVSTWLSFPGGPPCASCFEGQHPEGR